jgi:hypothetical protein
LAFSAGGAVANKAEPSPDGFFAASPLDGSDIHPTTPATTANMTAETIQAFLEGRCGVVLKSGFRLIVVMLTLLMAIMSLQMVGAPRSSHAVVQTSLYSFSPREFKSRLPS